MGHKICLTVVFFINDYHGNTGMLYELAGRMESDKHRDELSLARECSGRTDSWFLLVWTVGLECGGFGDKHCDHSLDFPHPMQRSHKTRHFFFFF